MDNFDYKPNSYRSKTEQTNNQEPKKVEKVVTGNVTAKKKSETAKIGSMLKDGVKDATSYMVKDILIPSGKKLFMDTITSWLNVLVYGSAKQPGTKRNIVDNVSYRQYWDRPERRPEEPVRSRFDFDSFTFEKKSDALAVLDTLDDLIVTYRFAKVSDLYDCIGKTCDYTYEYYGWDDLSAARVVGTPEGFVLDMPRVIPYRRR